MAQRDPQAGTDTQPALTGFPPQPTSTTADPAIPTLAFRSWLIRLGLLAAGLLAMRQALYIFYFQPWLGAKSWLDPWLERSRCLVTAWCGPGALSLHHGGVLLLLAALLCFGLALRTRPEDWPASVLPAWPAWLSRPRAHAHRRAALWADDGRGHSLRLLPALGGRRIPDRPDLDRRGRRAADGGDPVGSGRARRMGAHSDRLAGLRRDHSSHAGRGSAVGAQLRHCPLTARGYRHGMAGRQAQPPRRCLPARPRYLVDAGLRAAGADPRHAAQPGLAGRLRGRRMGLLPRGVGHPRRRGVPARPVLDPRSQRLPHAAALDLPGRGHADHAAGCLRLAVELGAAFCVVRACGLRDRQLAGWAHGGVAGRRALCRQPCPAHLFAHPLQQHLCLARHLPGVGGAGLGRTRAQRHARMCWWGSSWARAI